MVGRQEAAVDLATGEHLAAYAVGLLLALPVAAAVLWKVMDTTRKRRARAAMKEGNRIYKDWLDSSSQLSGRK